MIRLTLLERIKADCIVRNQSKRFLVYMPFAPLAATPLVITNLFEDNNRKILTRYTSKVIRSDYYGIISLSDL